MWRYLEHVRTSAARVVFILTVVLGATVAAVPGSTAHAFTVTCGEDEVNWSGLLASTWTAEYFDGGTPYDALVALVNVGNVAVTENLDTLTTYNGTYYHTQDVNQLIWYGDSGGGGSDRLTFVVEATACGLNDRVTAAHGVVIRYNVGEIGVVNTARVT